MSAVKVDAAWVNSNRWKNALIQRDIYVIGSFEWNETSVSLKMSLNTSHVWLLVNTQRDIKHHADLELFSAEWR